MKLILNIPLIALILNLVGADDRRPYFRIPNPFGSHGPEQLNKIKGFYAIDSYQSSLSSTRDVERYEVQEYFSVEQGLTFSLQRNHNEPDKMFVIVGDSNHGKTYIIYRNDDQDDYQCELDNVRSHSYVFPWIFRYALPELKPDKPKRKKFNREGFIYGIGGIWLNAIDKQITSDQVGDNSPIPGSNVWTMEGDELQVRMLFDKPDPDCAKDQLQGLIENSKLNHVGIKRLGFVGHQDQATRFYGSELKEVFVRNIRSIDDPEQDETLSWLLKLIPQCRSKNRKHRVFPSLIQAASVSPERLFSIQYIETKFPLANDLKTGTFDHGRQRRVYDREFHSEWLSFRLETFSILHEGLDETNTDGEQDLFIKRFTKNKDGHRQSAVTYHQVFKDGKLASCVDGQAEHPPPDSLMVRAIHFHKLGGLLYGLGALLMNAVDIHHKEYSLFTRNILIIDDRTNVDSRIKIKANEWRFRDDKNSRVVHFYFRYKNSKGLVHDITDLVRIDIKRAANYTDDDAISGKIDNSVDGGDDPEIMIKRFDIVSISTEAQPEEIDYALKPAEICGHGQPSDDFSEDEFSQNEADLSELSDRFNEIHDVSFEFEPGKMMNSLEFPDFFEFLDGEPAYRIESRIEIFSGNEDESTESEYFRLVEQVDFESEQTILSIFSGDGSNPNFEYYINYNSELIFRTSNTLNECRLVTEVSETWLQTLSADLKYYRVPGRSTAPRDADRLKELAIIESSKLQTYGVGAMWRRAAESEDSDLVGLKKEIVVRDGAKYKEVVWSYEPQSDGIGNNLRFEFGFNWNLSKWREDQKNNINRRTIELLNLDWIHYDVKPGLQVDSFLRRLNIYPISINFNHLTPWILPGSCSDAIKEAEMISEREAMTFIDNIKIPSISDFIGGAKKYQANYTIRHSPIFADISEKSGGDFFEISEVFDARQNRAKLSVFNEGVRNWREVYIDGQTKRICVKFIKENTCKRIARLEGLIDLGKTADLANKNFEADKMYALGALWLKLEQFKDVVLKITYRYMNTGEKQEIRTYRVKTTFPTRLMATMEYLIEIRFSADIAQDLSEKSSLPGPVKLKYEQSFVLEKIDFIPNQTRGRKQTQLHRTTIEILSLKHLTNMSWDLPVECSSCMDAANDNLGDDSFPMISKLMQNGQVFHMKSEITSSSPLVGGAKSLLIIDEWFLSGKEQIRIKSSRLARNLDILLFVGTRESFDLSVAYQCPTKLPKLISKSLQSDPNQSKKVLEFWMDDARLVDKLAELYFAPAALWWLAEKNLANVRLASSIDLAPLPLDVESSLPVNSLERELRTERWLVTSPPEMKPAWRFEMEFERIAETLPDGTELLSHSLESITLSDPEYLGLSTEVEIDIISYKREQATHEMIMDYFMVPEGYGCVREQPILEKMYKFPDDVIFSKENALKISYEASLELSSDDRRAILPTASGRLLSSGSNGSIGYVTGMDMMAHYSRVRLPNGHARSSKTVYDRYNKLFFDIDRSTGFCSIDRARTYDWSLDFSGMLGEFESHTVILHDRLFRLLFLDTISQKFVLTNRWEFDGTCTSTYELMLDYLELSEQLRGPATIIRKYENLDWSPPVVRLKGNHSTRLHDSLSVKVLLFKDQTRTQVRAIFGIRLRKASNIDLSELLDSINVSQCYNDGSATSDKRTSKFAIEYSDLDMETMEWIVFNIDMVESIFARTLIQKARILPIQFVANPDIDFSRNLPSEGNIRFRFSLLDPPTAIEYFDGGSRMDLSELYSALGEVRIVEDIQSCSRWCDQIDCTALTYCHAHLCRVITDNMLADKRELLYSIKRGEASSYSETCSFFYYPLDRSERAQMLENFVSFVDLAINEGQNLAEAFALDLNGLQAWPSKFTKEPSDFWVYRDDIRSLNAGYVLIKSDMSLDTGNIDRLESRVNEGQKAKYSLTPFQVSSYAECLKKCSLEGCLLLSYGGQSNICQAVFGSGELKPILSGAIRNENLSARYTITARNYLSEYRRFGGTREPQQMDTKLVDYSPLECASACSSLSISGDGRPKCLSFDHCRHSNVCYLQSSYVALDSLDYKILKTQHDDEPNCDHYSKSALASFKKLQNKRYINEGPIERGIDLEKCAISCHGSDLCSGFEFCFDDNHKPAQSCLQIMTADIRGSDQFEDFLLPSAVCSIYRLVHDEKQISWEFRDSKSNEEQVDLAGKSDFWKKGWPIYLVFLALMAGLFIQLTLYRLFRNKIGK